MTITPAMQQYYDMKEQYSDSILFFRMGDFYEMFEKDAQIAHEVLGINITSRNKNSLEPIPLAGIPYHALDKYLPQLVKAGYKVAISEQVSDPRLKGIVKREVVRVVTPATLGLEGEAYDSSTTNVIVSIAAHKNKYAISFLELIDGNWSCGSFETLEQLGTEIFRLDPKELIISKELSNNQELWEILSLKQQHSIYYVDFRKDAKQFLLEHFGTNSLGAYGIENSGECIEACASLLYYLGENQKSSLKHLSSLSCISFDGYLELDESTIKNLDLLYNFATTSQKLGTLIGVIDKTKTSMGKRLIRQNILKPYFDKQKIEERHDIIEQFLEQPLLLEKVQKELKSVGDIDAIISRMHLGRASVKDLLKLKYSLISISKASDYIRESKNMKLISLLKL